MSKQINTPERKHGNFIFFAVLISILLLIVFSSCNSPDHYEDWNYTAVLVDLDSEAESKITPTLLTEKKMSFYFKEALEEGIETELELKRHSTETPYFTGEYKIKQSNGDIRTYDVEVEKKDDGCLIGLITNRNNADQTHMKMEKPGVNCPD